MLDLFSDTPPWQEPLAPGAVVLRRFARERAPALLQAIADVASQSPFRQMVTPGGYTMSVAMTNCGALGWTTDRHGYLYAGDGGYRAVEHGVPGTRHPGVGRGRQAGGRRAAAIPVAAGLGA
ncbi:hypothetical protein PRR77_20545, partial [Klebsiella pneumoniae]|nr:hypothetical protein [Klebsiella pneumoniae]